MPKRIRTATHPRRKVCLNSIRGVADEQARAYRMYLNGKIKAREMNQAMFGLREIRCSLEAIPSDPVVEQRATFNIIEVPSNCYVRSTEGLATSIGPLAIEHRPAEEVAIEPDSAQPSSSEIIDRARDFSSLKDLEARLTAMSREELLALAGIVDEDERAAG